MPILPITEVASIFPIKRTGNTEGYGNSPDYQNVNVCVAPTGVDIQASYGGVSSYQVFEIFIYDVTIPVRGGDKIVLSNNQAYIVDGQPYLINNRFLQYIRVLGKVAV